MDPNATLQAIERELHSTRDHAILREYREALYGWLDNAGFEPNWDSCPDATIYFHYGLLPEAPYDYPAGASCYRASKDTL